MRLAEGKSDEAAVDLKKLLDRALEDDDRGIGHTPQQVEGDALSAIAQNARGDARRALSASAKTVSRPPIRSI